jgi:hypothetical protein
MGSNPTQGMDVCLYSVFVLGRGSCELIPRPRSPINCLTLKNCRETKSVTDVLCSKWEQEEEREGEGGEE